jgi:hypothetical protein
MVLRSGPSRRTHRTVLSVHHHAVRLDAMQQKSRRLSRLAAHNRFGRLRALGRKRESTTHIRRGILREIPAIVVCEGDLVFALIYAVCASKVHGPLDLSHGRRGRRPF